MVGFESLRSTGAKVLHWWADGPFGDPAQFLHRLLTWLMVLALMIILAINVSSLVLKHIGALSLVRVAYAAEGTHSVSGVVSDVDKGANPPRAGTPLSVPLSAASLPLVPASASLPALVPSPISAEVPSTADTLSALALVIAVVTLVLTWGANWIHTQGQRTARLVSKVEKKMVEVDLRLAALSGHRQALQLWAGASEELAYQLQSASRVSGDLATQLSLRLLGLLDESIEERRKTFGVLLANLGGFKEKEKELPKCCAFMIACHKLADTNPNATHDTVSFTRLFSRVDIAAYEEWLLRRRPKLGSTS